MKVFAIMLSLAAAPVAAADVIHFTTEDYPPYNFRVGSEIRGAGYDQVLLMMKDINHPYSIEMMPWARAIALAESEPMHCVFTTAHIPERDTRFKWVEPVAVGRNFMVSHKNSGIKVADIEEAKRHIVGTQRNDYTQTLLENEGFPKIDLATDLKLTLKKLESKRIDLMPISEQHYIELLEKGIDLEAQFVFSEQKFAIACNVNFPADLLARMQGALDKLIADGTQAEIFETYDLRYSSFGQVAAKP
ncbi:amino acid ABC transporter substrate-binding protein [Agrobacterium albertimagni AOL15]|uniref:Amino acid ABC transporter substrate-binding protein n=2 Tax=Agrobacterium albertimagni TaxID=147266 RepID=K2Q8B7_9HYPH|nr:transporter substrate-binding domain-containing protein [Agrobacterium albertimagni]EKF60029.1 amino acid ABC transporter substrate-binding protein [Agrobacterium albertimagni AOL15]